MVGVPLQNNTNFNKGPLSGTQNVLNIQPVVPVTINLDWNLMTRTIVLLIGLPEFVPGQGSSFGLGDIQLTGMVSPAEPGAGGAELGPRHFGAAPASPPWRRRPPPCRRSRTRRSTSPLPTCRCPTPLR